jgi:hypothetical protein
MFCRSFVCLMICLAMAGCADIQAPRTDEILKQPMGSGGLYAGMTKAQVVERYGEPDIKGMVGSTGWNEPREEWVYQGRYSLLPVNAGYLSEDLYLYFDGENLTNISKKPLGMSEQEGSDDSVK